MLFDNTDFDYAISFLSIPGSDFTKETRVDKFLTPEEGFLKGNLEKNEYVPYKNYTYFKLQPETEKENLLFKLMAYSFAINDLNLYPPIFTCLFLSKKIVSIPFSLHNL